MHLTTSGVTARKLIENSESLGIASRRIAKKTVNLLEAPIAEIFSNRVLNGSHADCLRVLSSFEPKDEPERVARSLVLLNAYRAEQESPGSAFLFLKLLLGEKFADRKSEKLKNQNLSKLLHSVGDPTVHSMLMNAIELAGPNGNISIKTGGITHISVDDSSAFSVVVSPSFISANHLTSRIVVVFDGVIESVGQINRFLEDCASSKVSALLMARAFSSEVVSTIYANNARGVFDIVPVTPGIGIEDEFTIQDVANVTGAILDNLVKLENGSSQHDIVIEKGNLKINFKELKYRDSHIARLRKEISDFKDENIRKLVSNRIARISGRRISVCIGNEFGDMIDVIKERFDHGMRFFMSSRKKGIIIVKDEIFPGSSLYVAQRTYNSFLQLINNTGGVLALDRKMVVAKRRRS